MLIGDPEAPPKDNRVDSLELGTATAFCSAKPTTIPGCLVHVGLSGAPSAATPQSCAVVAAPAPGDRLGIFLWSHRGEAAIPFQGGYLCVQPPVLRSTAKPTGGTLQGCDGHYSMSLAEIAAQDPLFAVGAYFVVQAWVRDPGNLFSSALSDGLAFVVCN